MKQASIFYKYKHIYLLRQKMLLKLICYIRYLIILGLFWNPAAFGNDIGKELAKYARTFIGTGQYVMESDSFFVSNQKYAFKLNRWFGYEPNDFRILFTNWPHFHSSEFQFLEQIAEKNYQNNKLRMNCWQFVLLVLLGQNLITKDDIENLYFHVDTGTFKNTNWVGSLWDSKARDHSPLIGDIALYRRLDPFQAGESVWHVAIVSSVNNDGSVNVIEILNYNVKETTARNVHFISPENAALAIKALERGDFGKHPEKCLMLMREFINFAKGYFNDEVEKEVKKKFPDNGAWQRDWKETENRENYAEEVFNNMLKEHNIVPECKTEKCCVK